MSQRIKWTCSDCGDPIADGEGAIVLTTEDNWIIEHFCCGGKYEAILYPIAVERCRTYDDLCWWDDELNRCGLVEGTNWDRVSGAARLRAIFIDWSTFWQDA